MAKNTDKDRQMASQLRERGIWHGRRLTQGLSNIPNIKEKGSAAYRRLRAKEGKV